MWGQKKHKYGAKKTTVNGKTFPSKLEGALYQKLLDMEQLGHISELREQHSVRLKDKCEHCGSAAVAWKVDFSYTDVNGELRFAEAKGAEDASYKRRKKLWLEYGPAPCDIWKGSARYLQITETLMPKKQLLD